MDSSTEELLPGPATYVPEPFQGLPPVFGETDAAPRGWRSRHRPGRVARREKPADQDAAGFRGVPATLPAVPQPPERVVSEPVVSEPVLAEPVVAQPVMAEPVVADPVVAQPLVAQPVMAEPVVADPVVAQPLVAQPLVAQPVVAEIVTPQPLVAPPTPPAAPPQRPARPAPAPVPVAPEPPATAPLAADPSPPANLPSYRPEPYDPKTAGAVLQATDILQLYGVVLPRRRGKAARVTLALLLAVLVGAGYYAWRQLSHDKPSAGPVTYTSTAGRFSAQFPKAPTASTQVHHIGAHVRATTQLAADPDDHVAVAAVRITPAPSDRQLVAALPGLSRGLAGDGTLILANQHRTAFRGQAALTGEFWAADGSTMSFLAVSYGTGQLYLLLAPSGASFTQLETSFQPLH